MQLDVPYGYLFDYSQQRGKYWPLDNGKVNKVKHLNIVVSDKTFLKPYGTDTKELFLKLIDGKESDGIRILVMSAEKCQKLNIDFAMRVELNDGFTAMESSNSNYLAYESHEKNAAYAYRANYYKKADSLNSAIITIKRYAKASPEKFNGTVTRCSQGVYLQYYLNFHHYPSPPTLDEVIEINDGIDRLLHSFMVDGL